MCIILIVIVQCYKRKLRLFEQNQTVWASQTSLLWQGCLSWGWQGYPQFLSDQSYYLKQESRLCSPHYYLPHQIFRPSCTSIWRTWTINYLASTNSQMVYSLTIKSEAKIISDKNTMALHLIVFISSDLFQEKKIKIVRFVLNCTCKQQGLVSTNSQRFKL